jgi:hypothetical protein
MQATSWRKSSRSTNSGDQNCVECRQTWRKPSRSTSGPEQNCVEARSLEGQFQVRDSKLGHDSPVFDLAAAEFTSLLRATAARLPTYRMGLPAGAGSRSVFERDDQSSPRPGRQRSAEATAAADDHTQMTTPAASAAAQQTPTNRGVMRLTPGLVTGRTAG